MKQCSCCGTEKPLDDFYVWKRARDGRMARCKPCHRQRLAAKAACIDCGGAVSHQHVERCQTCRAIQKRGAGSPQWRGGRIQKDGYIYLSGLFDHPNAVDGQIAEHRVVMAALIGRPLLRSETVHHKNGVRDDNRPENLELWSESQPAGQRVVDKVEWAKDILRTYDPSWLAEHEGALA